MTRNLKTKLLTSLITISMLVSGCSSSENDKVESTTTKENVIIQENVVSDAVVEDNSVSENTTNLSEAIITYINTGNSDAILVEQNEKYLLIDSGDNDDEKFMVNYLKNKNINKIDYFLLTHFDADHIGSADKIIDNIEIGKLLVPNGDADTKTYRDFIQSASNKKVAPSVPLEGAKFELGSGYFEIFNTDGGGNRNDDSLVVKFTNGEDTFAFMGDAGKEIEKKVVNKIGDIDVLKAGHHGSHTSSGYDFVKTVNPEYAIILSSKDNKYGHPHKETMDTFKELDIEVHRSDECGDIVFKSSGKGVSTDCKEGSYKVGVNSKYSNSSSVDKNTTNNSMNNITVKEELNNTVETVYWTPNGSVYHIKSNCNTLSKSKTILNGSIDESKKARACKVCG